MTGLCARGGFELDLDWSGGVLTRAVIRSKTGGTAVLRSAGRELAVSLKTGERLEVDGTLQPRAPRRLQTD